MANQFKISNVAANAEVDALTVLLNSGYVRIYDGTKPATVDTAITSQVLLAELTMGNPAFGAGSAGVAAANAITQDASANATGTPSWFRAFKTDGTTAVCDGTVGTSGCDLNLDSATITSGVPVSISSWTITQGKG